MEIFGLSDWIRGVTDQLAKEGFIAIAPDFLSGMGRTRAAAPSSGAGRDAGHRRRDARRSDAHHE
jgi:carboxymethylenebutenolidase